MSKKFLVNGILGAVLILVALAIVTVLPFSAPQANAMGYVSTCPFAPYSTFMLLITAGILWMVRGYIVTRVD